MIKQVLCPNCGAKLNVDTDQTDNNGEWLCLLPEGFEWVLPAGKITPVVGDPIYISAYGEHLSWQEYLDKYDVDPEKAYNLMRARRGLISAQQKASEKQNERVRVSKGLRSNLLDDDDWTH